VAPIEPGNEKLARCDVSVIIPAKSEGQNLALLLPQVATQLASLGLSHEILVVTTQADEETRRACDTGGARALVQVEPGYGGALLTGFQRARGEYFLTMDADLSHRPTFIDKLWHARDRAEIVVASRYVPGGSARMPVGRYLLSRVLNVFLRRGLSVPVSDLSSGFRLFRADVVRRRILNSRDFDILQEILVRGFCEGWVVREVPFRYEPRRHGSSHARVMRVGRACLSTFFSLWKIRNSILAADYDYRAYDSPIFLQKYWQRKRYKHVTELIAGQGPVLDVGCGSSRIIGALPAGSVGVDVLLRKLRFARRFGGFLVQASGLQLPFQDGSFPCVLCSQVIEHVPKESPILDELCRVLAPGGRLVLGTPDYSKWQWIWMEKAYGIAAPGGYADEHIAHYTFDELVSMFERRGYRLEAWRYILRGELIMAFTKLRGVGERSGETSGR
jgi:dolichol-phosphate mannosyltransferase